MWRLQLFVMALLCWETKLAAIVQVEAAGGYRLHQLTYDTNSQKDKTSQVRAYEYAGNILTDPFKVRNGLGMKLKPVPIAFGFCWRRLTYDRSSLLTDQLESNAGTASTFSTITETSTESSYGPIIKIWLPLESSKLDFRIAYLRGEETRNNSYSGTTTAGDESVDISQTSTRSSTLSGLESGVGATTSLMSGILGFLEVSYYYGQQKLKSFQQELTSDGQTTENSDSVLTKREKAAKNVRSAGVRIGFTLDL